MTNLIPLINTVLSKELQSLIYFLGYWSQKNSFKIYGMGSFVRDLVLGRENRVIALLVDRSAVDFARSLQEVLPAGQLWFDEEKGTAKLFLPRGIFFDMVTAKKEFHSLTGSDEAIEKATLKNELFSNNFTINTMACAFNPQEFGWLYDFFGGRDDLEKGLIRVLYRLSFVDDPGRMLQAIRFEQRFDFEMEEETKVLLQKARNNSLLKKISKEKINSEARLIFLEPSPLKVLIRLQEFNLFGTIFPRLVLNENIRFRLQKLEQILAELQDKKMPIKKSSHFILFLSVFFDGLDEHDMLYICYLLRLKRKECLKILFIRKKLKPILNAVLENKGEEKGKRLVLLNFWLEKYGSLRH